MADSHVPRFTEAASGAHVYLWNPKRVDALALAALALLPIVVALPQLLGLLNADPMVYYGELALNARPGWLPGIPYNDPNNAFTTQALGIRAMLDWLNGVVPWWNPYSGVGLPLAAEYQPAAFFPLTMLILLPKGMVWQHVSLQILSGWGTYALLRQIGLGRSAAVAGGLMFGFNGTLAWFAHGPAGPVPFLPWLLLGIERARTKAETGKLGGWRLLALALAMSLLAGFPETAYINGLLALAWSVLRWVQTSTDKRLAYTRSVTIGGIVGLGLSAPQLLSFFEYLPHAFIGVHQGPVGDASFAAAHLFPSLVAPYIYGTLPKWVFSPWPGLAWVWVPLGGYVGLALLSSAIYGFLVRRNALAWLLFGWTVVVLSKSFGFPPAVSLMHWIPGIAESAFLRYAQPSWEFSLIVLSTYAVDELSRPGAKLRLRLLLISGVVAVTLMAAVVIYLSKSCSAQAESARCYWAMVAVLWACLTTFLVFATVSSALPINRGKALAFILILDSILLFSIPTLTNPRGGEIDKPAITFLQQNLQFQRFYSMGPIQANYSAAFGIANINHNYLPVAQRWVDWVHDHLDNSTDRVAFSGYAGQGQEKQVAEIKKNLSNFQWVGVKYVVVPAENDPFIDSMSTQTTEDRNQPLVLGAGPPVEGVLSEVFVNRSVKVTTVGVMLGYRGKSASGMVQVTLCAGDICVSGEADLTYSTPNAIFKIPLSTPLRIDPNTKVRYAFKQVGGKKNVALWAYPVTESSKDQQISGPEGILPGMGLRLHLYSADAKSFERQVKLVYSDGLMDIFELPDPKPYFDTSGESCKVRTGISRTHVQVACTAPGQLIRRELLFPGWKAEVNGVATEIQEYNGLFQIIDLPEGNKEVDFSYSPPYVNWAWLAMWLSVVALLVPAMRRHN